AKQDFFTHLKPTAVAITNIDDPYGAAMIEHTVANIHSYGLQDQTAFGSSDIVASGINYSLHGTSFTIKKRYSDETAQISSKLVGTFNVQNMLAATSALYFGVEGCSLPALAELSNTIEPVRGRFEQIVLANGAVAIIDYAHTPDALENVLITIRDLAPMAHITTVFGCGGDRDKTKRPIMGAVAEKYSDRVIITNDNPRTEDPATIAQEIQDGLSKADAEIILDRAKAIEMALRESTKDTVILIAGKGHEEYQIIGKERNHFNDKEEVLKFSKTFS
ncbi:MAG TPA: UDP-N-acetylmuramyl-tripeptide synthetase, partial [Candidatus Kapabacteria bacterium]|nr:UDP-N-acetylmuramyl-tripeptide synthetase [Candidatus Kapabacteria bacterium]